MHTLFAETRKRNLLGAGLSMVSNNKRYIFWFWLLNLTLAEFGTQGFRNAAHAILDHSLYANQLTQGFHIAAFFELLSRPDFGSMKTVTTPSIFFACIFFLATAVFLPGVFAGYASTYRLPREDFFRACGRNLWRFIRLMIVAAVVMGIFAGVLFAINGKIVEQAGESTNEVLPFDVRIIGLAVIFLIMTTLRIWFDLAEADIVLNDRRAVRKSIAAGFRQTFRSLGRLLGSYILTAIVAAIVLLLGLWVWLRFVPAQSLIRAFVVGQITLFLLLIPRFWQRGIAVSYWQLHMLVPVAAVQPNEPAPPTRLVTPELPPVVPETPPEAPSA